MTLLIFPVYEEEAMSSQCAFCWVPKQRGSTKNNPSKRTLTGWENLESPYQVSVYLPPPALADGRQMFSFLGSIA